MNSAEYRDLFDFEVPSDEELPDYEPATAPAYANEDFDTPIHTFYLRQTNRKLQYWVPYGPSGTSTFKIISRGFRVFSKKPDMQIMRTSHGENVPSHPIASLAFHNDGPLPWRPRANVTHVDSRNITTKHYMESRNFADWTVNIGDITYAWRLEDKPIALVLSEKTSTLIIARFTYSSCGTDATNGAEVGGLVIYRDALSVNRDGVEKIIASLMISIGHFKKMGRHYWNDTRTSATSLTGEHLLSHRGSVASHSSG
jgi:hypothetical protein